MDTETALKIITFLLFTVYVIAYAVYSWLLIADHKRTSTRRPRNLAQEILMDREQQP